MVAGRHGHTDAAQPVAVREPAAGELVGQARGAVGAGELRGTPLGRTPSTQPRWVGVEDVDAPEPAVARVPQQHPVAHPQRQGALEREPGDATARVAERAVPHRDVRCPDVQLRGERRTGVAGAGPRSQAYVDHLGVVPRVGGGQHRLARDPVDVTGEVERDAGGAAHRVGVLPERLQPADAHQPVAVGEGVADPDGAGGQGAGDHGARTPHGEASVHPEAYVGVRVGWWQRGEHVGEGGAEVVEPGARAAADGDDRCAGQAGAGHLGRRPCHGGPGVGEVAARDGDDPVADAEGVERGEVLGRLRHPRVVGRDDQQGRRHRPDAREHRGEEPLVARDVDERHLIESPRPGHDVQA